MSDNFRSGGLVVVTQSTRESRCLFLILGGFVKMGGTFNFDRGLRWFYLCHMRLVLQIPPSIDCVGEVKSAKIVNFEVLFDILACQLREHRQKYGVLSKSAQKVLFLRVWLKKPQK